MKSNTPKILLADDDGLLRDVLARMLSNYHIIQAENGLEAVKLYFTYKPDLVLMDVRMPVLDGIDATKAIMELDPKAKILAITAYASKKGEDMLEAGAKEIISKPMTRKKLVETIERHLNSSCSFSY